MTVFVAPVSKMNQSGSELFTRARTNGRLLIISNLMLRADEREENLCAGPDCVRRFWDRRCAAAIDVCAREPATIRLKVSKDRLLNKRIAILI